MIINKQINILTNTKDSGNHYKKHKIFTQFPSKETPRKCTVSADPWVNRPKILQRRHTLPLPHPPPPSPQKKHRETRPYFPILRNEQIQNVYKKSQKIQNIYHFFSSDVLQKGDVNQMKPT